VDGSPGIRGSLAALGRAGLAVTAATAAANLLAYLPPVLAARRLAPADLGALAAALALVAIATMPGVGLQTAVAVATARSGASVAAVRQSWFCALTCGGVLLLGTPVLAAALRLPLALPPLLAAMTVPAVLAGWPLGLLQGSERFGRLAAGTVLLALGRYAGVLLGLAAGFGLIGTFALAALVAWLLPPALSWLPGKPARGAAADPAPGGRSIASPASAATVAGDGASSAGDAATVTSDGATVGWGDHAPAGDGAVAGSAAEGTTPGEGMPAGERVAASAAPAGEVRGRAVFTAASASLAILVASYADLILARRLLPPSESGAYSVGAVLTRAAIWAPQVVTIVALPRLVRGGPALRIGFALVAGCGAVLVTGAVLAGGPLIGAVGGTRYATLAHLAPYFVLVGALYAITVLLVNAQLAESARHPAAGVWTALAALVVLVAALRPDTVARLLACSVGAAALSALATAALRWRRKTFTSAR